MDNLLAALIAAEEAGGGVPQLIRNYSVFQSITQGKMARLISDGTVNDLPTGIFANDQTAATAIYSGLSGCSVMATYNLSNGYTFVLFYSSGNLTMYGTVVNLTGTTITSTTPVVIATASATVYTAAGGARTLVPIDSTRFLLTWQEGTNVKATVLTITTTSVSLGGINTIVSDCLSGSGDFDVAWLNKSSPTFLLTYCLNAASASVTIKAVAFTVSGSTISTGAAIVAFTSTYSSFGASYPTAAYFNTNQAALFCVGCTGSNATNMYQMIITLSGTTTIAVSGSSTLSTGYFTYSLMANEFATGIVQLCWGNSPVGGGSNYPSYVTISISGTTFTQKVTGLSGTTTGHGTTGYYQLTPVGSNTYILYTQSDSVWVIKLNADGTGTTTQITGITTAPGIEYDAVNNRLYMSDQYNSKLYVYQFNAGMTSITSLITDGTNNYIQRGSSYALNSSGYALATITNTGDKVLALWHDTTNNTFKAYTVTPSKMTGKSDMILGVAMNNSGLVMLRGIVNVMSSLIPGKPYGYSTTGDGTITQGGATNLGTALSSTEILLKDYIF